jgi:3-hydroxybutyryl-CoA dehydratase
MKSHLPPELEPVSLTVTPAAIEAYAQLTQDFNPIHLDPEFAARTPMGGVIAHGTMSVGLIWRALAQSLLPDDFCNIRLDVRFVKPIRLQETVVAGGRLQAGDQPLYDVWVQGAEDGVERIVGTAQLLA